MSAAAALTDGSGRLSIERWTPRRPPSNGSSIKGCQEQSSRSRTWTTTTESFARSSSGISSFALKRGTRAASACRELGSVFVMRGFHEKGAVRALGAGIKGTLDCAGATLENPDGYALVLDGAEIAGGVFLTERFHATGEVRALGAQIRGPLDCSGAS